MFSGLYYLVHVNKEKIDKYDKLSYSISFDFGFAISYLIFLPLHIWVHAEC